MSNTLGNLELNILLKTDQLSAGAKAAISIIEQVAKAGNTVGLFDKIDFSKFVSEINKVHNEQTKLQEDARNSSAAVDGLDKSLANIPVTLGNGNTVIETFSNSLTRIGWMKDGIDAITESFANLKSQFIDSGLKADVMREHFKGTEEHLESFRIATGRIADDMTLIRISNQATDLGISLRDQTVLFYMVKEAADKYGTDLESAFQKVMYVNEGNTKILKYLGVQKGLYNKLIDDSVKQYFEENNLLDKHGKYLGENGEAQKINISLLPLEQQERIRLNALIKAGNVTYDDATKRVQTNSDKIEMLSVVTKNAEESIGSFIGRALVKLMDQLHITNPEIAAGAGHFIAMGSAANTIIPLIANLVQIFPKLGDSISNNISKAAGTLTFQLGLLGTALIVTKLLVDEINNQSAKMQHYKSTHPNEEKYITQHPEQLSGIPTPQNEVRKFGKYELPFNPTTGQYAPEQIGQSLDKTKMLPIALEKAKEEDAKLNQELKDTDDNLDKILPKFDKLGKSGTDAPEKKDTSFEDAIEKLNTELKYLELTGKLNQENAEAQIASLRSMDSENLELAKKVTLLEAIKTRVIKIIELQGEASGEYDGDIAARVKARIDAMRQAYEEKAGKLTKEGLKDERYKGFDEASAMKKAYQIERGLVDEKVSADDLQAIIKFLDEGIVRLTGLKGQDDAIRQYTKERTTAEKELNKILDDRAKISDKNKELAIQTNKALSPEQKEIALLKLKYDIELQAIVQKIEAIKTLDKEQTKLYSTQRKLTEEEKKQAVQDKIKAINLSKLESLQSSVTEATQAFFGALTTEGGTAGSALKALLKNLLNQLLTYVETKIILAKVSAAADAVLSGGLTLLKDAPLLAIAIAALEGARAYVNSFHTGGAVTGKDEQIALLQSGEHVMNRKAVNNLGHNFFDYINSGGLPGRYGKYMTNNVNPAVSTSVREVPYIADTVVKGNDLRIIMRRADAKHLKKIIT
jgi:hypothetical protein